MIQKILDRHHSHVIAGPEFAQQIAGESLGLAQIRVKTLTGLRSLEEAHQAMLQAFMFGAEDKRDFTAIREWLLFHGNLKLFLILDVRNVTRPNIRWWLDSLEVLRRGEPRLIFFTCLDQEASNLMAGSNFLSRSAFLGNFLS